MRYKIPLAILSDTFDYFRHCGRGQRECQALWVSPWQSTHTITDVIHPAHTAHTQGFSLDPAWLNAFWLYLAEMNKGVRVQVHTHPRLAFHSPTDDAFPIIHTQGFLSLVIPSFATGPVSLAGAYLAEITSNGSWREVGCDSRLVII